MYKGLMYKSLLYNWVSWYSSIGILAHAIMGVLSQPTQYRGIDHICVQELIKINPLKTR
jgi:hypothetical protein